MSSLYTESGLSRKYTNHCIRAQVTITLHEQGFSNRAIMSVTGYTNLTSLVSYIDPIEDEREKPSSDCYKMSIETKIQKIKTPKESQKHRKCKMLQARFD